MGMFLAMSGVINASSEDVFKCLKDFTEQNSGGIEQSNKSTKNDNIGIIHQTGKNSTVFYPRDFYDWDNASEHISRTLNTPVFSFHIHDGDLWMYVLFDNGKEVDCFNPIPDYWEKISKKERKKWQGSPEIVSQLVPQVSADSIKNYFTQWDYNQVDYPKAYPDDEFSTGDCWQLCDFMEKLGLEYPIDDNGNESGQTYKIWAEFSDESSQNSNDKAKPWWKFWE